MKNYSRRYLNYRVTLVVEEEGIITLQPRLLNVKHHQHLKWEQEQLVLIVISTSGDGETSENFNPFRERRPPNIYFQEEINLYCIIKLATEISLFSLQISKT